MPAAPTPLRPPAWANMCGCAGHAHRAVTTPLPRLRTTVSAAVNASHIPTPPPTPPPTSQCRTRAAHPCVEVSPEAALQGLVGALRARHDPPPGQRAVPINGWKAVDELELIMRRWRATLDHSKKSEVALGKRKADACNKHFSRLKSYLQQRLPSQLVEAICNLTAEQLSPEPVRTAVMECTDPDESKRSAALKARMEQRGDGVDDSPADTDDVSTAKNSSRTLCTDWPDLSGALDSGGAFRGAASPLTAFGPTCSHAVPVARLVPTGLLSFSVDPHIQGRGAKKRTQRAKRLAHGHCREPSELC